MNFLRRKASKVGAEKSNKNNAKKVTQLAIIEDNEPANDSAEIEVSTTSSASNHGRRSSVAETIDSTSTSDSRKKKEGYFARLAADNQGTPQPWMNMSGMSHAALTTANQKNRPTKITINGSIPSARTSVDSVPASNLSLKTGETSLSTSYIPPPPKGVPPSVPHGMALPLGRRSPSNPFRESTQFAPPSPSYPPSRNSLLVPSGQNMPPALPLKVPKPGSIPPPMPSSAPPPPPTPTLAAPLGPLANPFRDEVPVLAPAPTVYTETAEISPSTTRPPPPPPPPPAAPSKLQRTPSRSHGPPPSSFSKHKRTLSGRVSPGPVNLPSPPVPPPPPPAPVASSSSSNQATDPVVSPVSAHPHSRQESLSAFPSPPSSTKSPERTQNWDSWIPDPTGYYGGPASFVVEMEGISKFPEPPSGTPGTHQELDSTTESQEQQMRAEEDLRETSKVLIPEGMTRPMPTPSDRTISRNDSIFSNQTDAQPKMTDGIFLTTSEHAALLADISELRTRAASFESRAADFEYRAADFERRANSSEALATTLKNDLAELDKQNNSNIDRINEWEAYKTSIDTYIEKMGQDRQVLVDKLTNSAQAHKAMIAEKEQQLNAMKNQVTQMTNTVRDWQTYSQRMETDKSEAITRMTNEINRLKADHSELIQAHEISHKDDMDKLQMDHNIDRDRLATEHSAEIDRMNTAFDAARMDHEARRHELTLEIQALDAKAQDQDTLIRSYETKLTATMADLESRKEQNDGLTATNKNTMQDLKVTKVKLVNVTEELNKSKQLVEQLLPEISDARGELTQMRTLVNDMEARLDTANNEKNSVKEQLKQSMIAKGRLGTALKTAETQVTEKEKDIEALKKSNETMKKRMYLLGQRMAAKTEWWQGQIPTQPAATTVT
ncbi:hypothetical protein TWF694_005602 [Orbilia ellipsospora]|uniref:Uncharacterized protein n=1 Tax=Orbilia ellipsospora TaxID=2528407 RepID=A0AAV9WUT8_9PEZI